MDEIEPGLIVATCSHPTRFASRLTSFVWQHPWPFVVGLTAAATLLAYGDSLRLPFFYDDLQHLVWLRDQTPLSIFIGEAGRTYYRPLQFLAWKLYEIVFGRDSAFVYHALNLIVHTLDALLVVFLVRRLTVRQDRWWPAILAGLIFVVFPFAYQVVPLPASLTHPLATLFVLLTVLAYDRFQSKGQRRWLLAALGFGLLAFSSNESSILVAGLLALWAFIRGSSEKRWRWIGLFILLAGAYYLWYHSQQADNSGTLGIRKPETVVQNAVYVLEGLTFPLQPLGQVLMSFGAGDQAAASILALIALVGLAVPLVRCGRFRLFVFGVGWYGFCIAPASLLLSHNYLINAPRLMYVGSVGVAVLWAGAVEAIGDLRGPKWTCRLAAGALAAGILIPASVFVRQHMEMYTRTAAPLQTVIDVADRSQPTDRLLFVNLPAWLGPAIGWYPVGHEGVLLLQKTISMDDLLTANLGHTVPATAIEFDNLSSPQAYYYGIYGPSLDWGSLNSQVRKADRVYLTIYLPHSIDLIEAGRVTHTGESTKDALAAFDDGAVLEEAGWAICGNRLSVRLAWRAAPGGDWHVFVHLLKPDGTLAAQHDSPPMLGLYPFWQWSKGDRVEDIHPIDVSLLPHDRTYTIAVGLYDPGNGLRVTSITANGEQPADKAVRIGQLMLDGLQNKCR